MKLGDTVRVRKDAFPNDEMKHVMYAGWYGVITAVGVGRAYVDSDEFTRRTGQLQAVSFMAWFNVTELELLVHHLECCPGAEEGNGLCVYCRNTINGGLEVSLLKALEETPCNVCGNTGYYRY